MMIQILQEQMTSKEIDEILNATNTVEDEAMWIELNDKLKTTTNNEEVKSLMIEYIPKIYSYV